MFSNDRDGYRKVYFETWEKYQKGLALLPLEKQLIEVILLHPEYHILLNEPKRYQGLSFAPEENPFIHMSLHMSILEQIQMNRPQGILNIYNTLLEKNQDAHEAIHQMMACLAQVMWEAQQNGIMPQEEEYLKKLQNII